MSRKTTLGHEVTPFLAARIRAVFKRLPKGIAGYEEDLHELRVGARRLQVALPLLALEPNGRRVRRARRVLRDLIKAGGAGRDLDVILLLFEERLQAQSPDCRELRRIRSALRSAHTRSRSQTADAMMDVEIARLRKDLRRIVERPGETMSGAGIRLREELEREGAAILEAFETLGDGYDPPRLHRVRRRVRRLRYIAEIQGDVQERALQAPAVLRRLQSKLGKINDTHVLARWLERYSQHSEKQGRTLLAEAGRAELAFFEQRGRELHEAFRTLRPEALVRRAMSDLVGEPPPQTTANGRKGAAALVPTAEPLEP
jgi:CHAD domain-containing protein